MNNFKNNYNYKMAKGFSSLDELNMEILQHIRDQDLETVCKTNKYIAQLCKDKQIHARMLHFKAMQLQFIYQPDVNPETGNKIKIGKGTYHRLVKKYGPPKQLINPETKRVITKDSRTYRMLIYKGYTEEMLRSNTLI
jgi:hypothetical protein